MASNTDRTVREQQAVAAGGALPVDIVQAMGRAAPRVFGQAALDQARISGDGSMETAAKAAAALDKQAAPVMALVNRWGEASVQEVCDAGVNRNPQVVSRQVEAIMKAAMPQIAAHIAIRDPYVVKMERAFEGTPQFPPDSDTSLIAQIGRGVARSFGRAAEEEINLAPAARNEPDYVGLVNLLGEKAAQGAIDADKTLQPVAVSNKVQDMLRSALPELGDRIAVRDPVQATLDRAYSNQPGFTAMAEGLAGLAALPNSGLPTNTAVLAMQIEVATYQKVRDMWSEDGMGRALRDASDRLPAYDSRLLDQKVTQYAAASVVSEIAAEAASRTEPAALTPDHQRTVEATADKAKVQAAAVWEAGQGQIRAPAMAKVGVGMHPSGSLAHDLVSFASEKAVAVAASAKAPDVKTGEIAAYRLPMVAFGNPRGLVGREDQHAAYKAATAAIDSAAPTVGPTVGRMAGAAGVTAQRENIPDLVALAEQAAHAVVRRTTEDEPEVAAFKREHGIGAPGLPD